MATTNDFTFLLNYTRAAEASQKGGLALLKRNSHCGAVTLTLDWPKKWTVNLPCNPPFPPYQPLLLSPSLSLFTHVHVKYLHKVRAACLPFCNAVVSTAHLQCKGEKGRKEEGEQRKQEKGERDRESEVGKGRRSLSLTKKRSARGSLTVNIAGSSPLPSPYATANLHFLLSNFFGWQRCQTTRSQHWKFAWLDRKSCFRSERSSKGERGEEGE